MLGTKGSHGKWVCFLAAVLKRGSCSRGGGHHCTFAPHPGRAGPLTLRALCHPVHLIAHLTWARAGVERDPLLPRSSLSVMAMKEAPWIAAQELWECRVLRARTQGWRAPCVRTAGPESRVLQHLSGRKEIWGGAALTALRRRPHVQSLQHGKACVLRPWPQAWP